MTMADLSVKTATKEKLELKEPDKYDVLFLNDDVTTVEFVIKVLKNIFHKNIYIWGDPDIKLYLSYIQNNFTKCGKAAPKSNNQIFEQIKAT